MISRWHYWWKEAFDQYSPVRHTQTHTVSLAEQQTHSSKTIFSFDIHHRLLPEAFDLSDTKKYNNRSNGSKITPKKNHKKNNVSLPKSVINLCSNGLLLLFLVKLLPVQILSFTESYKLQVIIKGLRNITCF